MKKQNKFIGFIRRFHIIPKIVCFFFAFIFWVYVMQVDSPDNQDVFEDIPVILSGTTALENERNLSVFSGYETLIDVTVKGKKSDISKYSEEDIIVTADVSEIDASGMYNLELFFDLPSDLSFVKSSSSEISIFVDKRTTKNDIPVVPSIKAFKLSSSEYALGDIVCDTDFISVTGPETLINEISYASAEVNMGDEHLTESVTRDSNIVLKNQNNENIDSKYLKPSKTSVRVNIPIFGFKDIPLRTIGKHGYYSKDIAQVTVYPEVVRIKGEPAVLETIDHIDITTLDEKNIGESGDFIVDITLPDNVYLVDDQPKTATISVELKGLTKKTFAVDTIVIENAGKKKYTVLDKAVAVTVLCDAKALKTLKVEDISLVIDLTMYSEVKGTIYPTAEVVIDINEGTAYEVGTYSVKVEAK